MLDCYSVGVSVRVSTAVKRPQDHGLITDKHLFAMASIFRGLVSHHGATRCCAGRYGAGDLEQEEAVISLGMV